MDDLTMSCSRARLWQDVVRSRAALRASRRQRPLSSPARAASGGARRDLIVALEAYTARLTAEGAPVPYRMRDELRLLSSLVSLPGN